MATKEYPFGQLGYEIEKAIERDLDAKILITSHNSKPGLSKTTLAIQMARQWDPHGWNAEDKAFMDVFEYKDAYFSEEPGSVLVFDELEGEADNRRANSTKNVELSQAWAQLRFRNMVTIATLPTVSMLDKRMLEMADYWINVIWRGQAHPYKIVVNDFNHRVHRIRMGDGSAVIQYPKLPDNDPDYQLLSEMKKRSNQFDRAYISMEDHEEIVEKEREKAKREYRDELIRSLVNDLKISQTKLSKLEPIGLHQTRISQIASTNPAD